jgi:phosphate transport system protein
VITDHDQLAAMAESAETAAISLLARQQPVGRDLREIVGALQVVGNIERMGALAVHVAELARRRHPHHVVPKEVSDTIAELGRVAGELANSAREVLRTRDPARAAAIRDEDDAMDGIHRQLLMILMDERIWTYGIPAAVDVALLGRFYERFADQAVEVGRRVVFESTGQLLPEQEVGAY